MRVWCNLAPRGRDHFVQRQGRYFIYDSYSVPTYRFLLTEVLGLLRYVRTWFASVSLPTCVSWNA